MIDMFTSYNDLCREIDYLEIQLKLADIEREQWWIGGRLFNRVAMDNAAKRYDKLSNKIKRINEQLEAKKEAKKKVDAFITDFDGLEYKIAYKRYVEYKTLQEISYELNLSYAHIRRVHARMKNATMKQHTN